MHVFAVPSSHLAYVEAEISRLVREIRNDIDLRADEDERIQKLAAVPDVYIDPTATGTALVTVALTNELWESSNANHQPPR